MYICSQTNKNNMGTKMTRDFDALEQRRIAGAKLLDSGVSQAEVARRLNVSRMAVTKWQALLKKEGISGLKKASHVGRQPRLNNDLKTRIVKILKKGALAAGFGTDLWTLKRVGSIIKSESGFSYTQAGVWFLLRELGFSSQRPTTRAKQRDEKKIEQWKRKRWPLLKKTLDRKSK